MTQEQYLAHHGILGQRWGVRRYQNADGTLTASGKKRYKKAQKRLEKYGNKAIDDERKSEEYLRKSRTRSDTLYDNLSTIYSTKHVKDLEHYKKAEDIIRSLGKTPISKLEEMPELKVRYANSPYNNPHNIVGLPGHRPTKYQRKNY